MHHRHPEEAARRPSRRATARLHQRAAHPSRPASRAPQDDGTTLPLRESLLDHELSRLAVIALDKAASTEQLAGVADQRGTTADHDAIMRGLEPRQADIGEQLA